METESFARFFDHFDVVRGVGVDAFFVLDHKFDIAHIRSLRMVLNVIVGNAKHSVLLALSMCKNVGVYFVSISRSHVPSCRVG